jgi:hypothetical protein
MTNNCVKKPVDFVNVIQVYPNMFWQMPKHARVNLEYINKIHWLFDAFVGHLQWYYKNARSNYQEYVK